MNRLNTKILIPIIIAVIAIVAAISILPGAISRKGIDMRRFLTVSMSGYDTYGKAKINVDEAKLNAAIADYAKNKSVSDHEYTFKLSKDTDLKNGDEIWVRVFEDGKELTSNSVKNQMKNAEKVEEAESMEADSYVDMNNQTQGDQAQTDQQQATPEPQKNSLENPKAEVTNTDSKSKDIAFKDMKIKVEGLKSATIYTAADTFNSLVYNLSGVSPWMSISLSNQAKDENIKNYVSFTCNKQDHIAVGETIEFQNHVDAKSCERQGIRIYEGKCKVTVGNQYNSYVENPEKELSQSILQSIISKGSDTVTALSGKTVNLPDNKTETIDRIYDVKVADVEFLKIKNNASIFTDTYNGLYLTFSFNEIPRVYDQNQNPSPATRYVCVKIANIVLTPDGELDTDDLLVNSDSLMENSLSGYVTTMYNSKDDALKNAINGLDQYYDHKTLDLNALANAVQNRTLSASEADSVAD